MKSATSSRVAFTSALAVSTILLLRIGAAAEVYPSHPIKVVIGFAAGGPTDTLMRILSERMRASLGQPLIIENLTGATGTIAVGRVVQAAPDGYTISVGNTTNHVLNAAIFPLKYDLLNDL
jgi:tripartite-type tricarboxylate transporter receptor subunit TctC